jgi:hypothetical protein
MEWAAGGKSRYNMLANEQVILKRRVAKEHFLE